MFAIAAKAIFSGISAYLGAALTFLTTKPGVYLLIAGVAAGAYWYSGEQGYKRAHREDVAAQKLIDSQHALEDQAAITAAIKVGMIHQQALDAAVQKTADAAAKAREAQQQKTIDNLKRIASHVTPETDRTFPVPCGLLRMHDAAALGIAPEGLSNPPGLADGDSCPVTASHLAEVIVTNYGLYHEAEVQIDGLQHLARTLVAEMQGGDAK
jgi:hypothetical protein